MINRKRLDVPASISGRPITNRGVHLQPFGHHGDWLNRAAYWGDLLASMGMSWAVLLTDGDAVRQTHYGLNPLKVLLDAGVIPIIREYKQFPLPFTEQDTVRWTVDLYGEYGLKPFWIIRNEPFDDREWDRSRLPKDAWEIIMRVWARGAQFIATNGGYVGFPDGPAYDFNPFESIKAYDCQWIFDEGKGFYAGHHYGKNRPRDYPYDAVTRHGAQLTEEAYQRLLDDFADDPKWREEPLELLNQRRTELQSPNLTAIQDDTCWRAWEKVADWSLASFGYVVPMALTEGGWVPRDRPGSGPNTDIRVPHTTPKMVAKKTLQMYDTPSPFFAICPWLLADTDMGGVGWPFDAWHGWAYSETVDRDTGTKYGCKKPVILKLQETPPKEVQPRTEPMVLDVEGDTRDWVWIRENYGANYRRGASSLRLIEVHEYEGPATLDVWVVDSDGLPVEGVEFYCYDPHAPAIDGAEWYPQGMLKATGPDGRLSFPVESAAAAAGDGQGAVWPRGRGDILDKVGLLAGTRNRHLNGMWQWVAEGTSALPGAVPESKPEAEPEPEPTPGAQSSPVVAVQPGTTWQMAVEYRAGARILAGKLPQPGIQVTVTDPWGNAATVISGSKPEYGPGGFEVLAPNPAQYAVAFLDQSFKVQTQDGATIVTFTEVMSSAPTPKPEAKSEPTSEAATVPADQHWAVLLQKLQRIEELAAKLPKK